MRYQNSSMGSFPNAKAVCAVFVIRQHLHQVWRKEKKLYDPGYA